MDVALRHMSMRWSWAVLLLVVAAGCSGGSRKAAPTSVETPSTAVQIRAAAEYRGALRSPDTFVNALATTVGAIHGITGGTVPTAHPWSNLYAAKPASAFAAWCWRTVPSGYESYLVGPGPPIFHLGGTDFRPTPGSLAIT
jgi:hypothetical protein